MTSQGAPDAGATTRLDDHVARALELMASGEWRLILEHPNPAKGSTFFDLDLTKEIARRAASPPPPPGVGEPVAWTEAQVRAAYNHFMHDAEHPCSAIAFREAAAMLAAPPVGVEVVKLEWVAASGYPTWLWEAKALGGNFYVRHMPSESYRLEDGDERSLWPSLDAAFEAGQARFEHRIRSTLVPSSLLKEAEDALRPFARIAKLLAGDWPRGVWVAPLSGKDEGATIPKELPEDALVVCFGGEFFGGVSLDGIQLKDFRAALSVLARLGAAP